MPMPPVILMGMHRSGTSLLAGLLERLGLFIGWDRVKHPVNREAYFFNELNDWMLRQAGGSWDNPRVVDHILADPGTRELTVDYLRFMAASPRSVRFLGPGRYLKYRGLASIGEPWGWKDPRNTFLLPLWLDLFPDARVIYVERHGVDVANSLKVRRDRGMAEARSKYNAHKWFYHFRALKHGFSQSVRCGTLEGAFSLWEEYVDRACDHARTLGPERCLGIRYETLLADPETVLFDAARFSGLNPVAGELRTVAATLRPERGRAFMKDPVLLDFAVGVRARLQARGHDVAASEAQG